MQIEYSLDDKQLDKVDATLTMTMPLASWKALGDLQTQRWPSTELSFAIHELIRKVTAQHRGKF